MPNSPKKRTVQILQPILCCNFQQFPKNPQRADQNHNIDYNDRVEKEKIPCIGCGGKKRYSEKYCSLECFRLHNPGMTAEQKKEQMQNLKVSTGKNNIALSPQMIIEKESNRYI